MSAVRVGIVGLSAAGGFAAGAHLPALRSVDGYELRGVSASSPESAQCAAEKHDVPLAFANAEELAASEEIDLVVIAVKVQHHFDPVMAALQAGKMVMCEWPLGNGSAESLALADEARRRDARTAIGLQARSAPSVRFLRDLVADGYVGEVLSTTLLGSGFSWGGEVPNAAVRYSIDAANGATLVSIPMGHTLDAMCHVLGELTEFRTTMKTVRHRVLDVETGTLLQMTAPDQVAVTGVLASGAVAAIHYRGGMSRATNLHWEINGTAGDIVVSGPSGHLQLADLEIRAGRGSDSRLSVLEVPKKYHDVPAVAGQSARICNVANAYARFLHDLHNGTTLIPTFEDAARRHAVLDDIAACADSRRAT